MNKWIVSIQNPHFPIGTELTSNWDDTLFYYNNNLINNEITKFLMYNQILKKA